MTKRLRLACAAMCAIFSLLASLGFSRMNVANAAEARRRAIEQSGHEAVPVVVAKRELSAGERIARADVELNDWMGEYVPQGAIGSIEECLDERLTSAVAAGSVLCDVAFGSASEGEGVPSGYVAINVQLTKNLGVTSDCKPGTQAVAYVVGSGTPGVTLASPNARILAVRPSGSGLSSDTITLAVLPSDVAAVIAATRNDSLRLVLPAEDVSVIPDYPLAHTGEDSPEIAPLEVAPVEVEQLQQELVAAHEETGQPSQEGVEGQE